MNKENLISDLSQIKRQKSYDNHIKFQIFKVFGFIGLVVFISSLAVKPIVSGYNKMVDDNNKHLSEMTDNPTIDSIREQAALKKVESQNAERRGEKDEQFVQAETWAEFGDKAEQQMSDIWSSIKEKFSK